MADNKIQGRAKKYDGTAIDYVSIFNWNDGTCIAQVVPDAAGNWSVDRYTPLEFGVTYVADGCEPITHGSYTHTGTAINSGFFVNFFLEYNTGDASRPDYLPENTSLSTWDEYFSQVLGLGLIGTEVVKTRPASIHQQEKVIPIFDKSWVFYIQAYNSNGSQYMTIEFLDKSNAVVAAIKSKSESDYNSRLYYGYDLQNLTMTTTTDRSLTQGQVSFTDSKLIFTNSRAARYNASFELSADMKSVVKMRVSASVSLTDIALMSNNCISQFRLLPS